mmetsp:Transcript_24930/g.25147  ORF Transcript_24930/g.25147 Transcript_24930/m.25147 type:complete len:155 (-) Transcript_24930:165-629(-)
MLLYISLSLLALSLVSVSAFSPARNMHGIRRSNVQMNFLEDAVKFFSNMNKEASAKHILIKGPEGKSKCEELKTSLKEAENLSESFSELALKFSECPSAKRGGNLGTFKPGMMVKEFDQVCFEKEIGVVHGPVSTQFGNHLILITRRYEGEDKK